VDKHPVNPITPATFNDVFEMLERSNVPYVVVSGVAVVLHGYVRPLADLDIVVSALPDEQNRALHALMSAGFVPSIPVPPAFLRVLRMFDQFQREVDVFFRYQLPFDELWANSEQVSVGKSVVRVTSLEHLLRVKGMIGRPHDLEDVEALTLLNSHVG
jgi:hypothetical protein